MIPERADFVITLPNDEEWIADFLGAFLLLGERDNWETMGGLTSDEMSGEWFALFMLFAEGREMAFPPGLICPFGGLVAPAAWLLCDGTDVSRTVYSGLFAVIGEVYGPGDNSTTFTLPRFDARVPVGFAGGVGPFSDLGNIGGIVSHTLTVAELPIHTHVQNAHTHVQNGHDHQQRGATAFTAGGSFGANSGGSSPLGSFTTTETPINQSTTPTNQNTGSGTAHNNMPPYLVVNYIIKI